MEEGRCIEGVPPPHSPSCDVKGNEQKECGSQGAGCDQAVVGH